MKTPKLTLSADRNRLFFRTEDNETLSLCEESVKVFAPGAQKKIRVQGSTTNPKKRGWHKATISFNGLDIKTNKGSFPVHHRLYLYLRNQRFPFVKGSFYFRMEAA